MKTVAQIIKSKPDQAVHSITPQASMLEAATLMARHNVGALLVIEGERIAGIVSERDIARRGVLASDAPAQIPVLDIMSSPVQFVQPNQTTDDCMALMTEKRLRHLPVLDNGRLVGMLSIGDLVKDVISEQEFIIHQLEHYISGDRVEAAVWRS
ncbi:MAG: CBS domain-containing protein [Burkholderiaceae bacterium]|nr:CBS domain-containing protein [Burkholderiaceae bacterium]